MRLRSKRLGTSTGGGAGGDGSSGAADSTTADEAAVPTPAAKPPAKRKPEDIGIPALLLGGGAAVADIAAAADAVDQLPLRTAGFTATTLKSACDYLAARDPRLLPFIQEFPADRLLRKADDGNFATLAKAIVFQQLATGAAAAIYARVLQACDCTDVLTPEAVLAAPLPALRAAGLSERKASYIADLADYFSSGRLSDDKINAMDEAELEEALTAVRGIGLWTVHMHAMFHLGSPDVLPVGDLGVRRGMQHLYQFKELPTAAEMEEVSECWRPYRSLGSYYMWKVDAPRAASSKKSKKRKKA